MILIPSTCPKCGDQLSTPIRSKSRAGMVVQTCRNGECMHTVWTTAAYDLAPLPAPQHGQMFAPSTSGPEPPKPHAGAMDRFNRAQVSGTLRKAITQQRKEAAAAAEIDPKLHQLPESDR